MEYIKLQLAWTRSDVFRSATPAAKGTWVNLISYCADQENEGRIKDCMGWTKRRWMATCATSPAEIDACIDAQLVQWDGTTLHVRGYDVIGQRECLRQRERSRINRQKAREAIDNADTQDGMRTDYRTGTRTGTEGGTDTEHRAGTPYGAQASPDESKPNQAFTSTSTSLIPGTKTTTATTSDHAVKSPEEQKSITTATAAPLPEKPAPAPRSVMLERLNKQVEAVSPQRLKTALMESNLIGILEAFGCTLSDKIAGEWAREANGLQLGSVAVILAWRMRKKNPVRLPSGFTQAKKEWQALNHTTRKPIIAEILTGFGVSLETVPV